MTRPRSSIAERVNAARVAIENTQSDATIQAAVAQFGYSTERLNEGKQILDRARAAINAQIGAAGSQRDATAQLEAARKDAEAAYQALAKVARAVLIKEKAKLVSLGLTGKMPQTIAGFLTAAYAMFNNAQSPELQAALVGYGYDSAKLQSERALITAFDEANRRQEAAKGTAQQSTRDQDAALKALDQWYQQYIKIARVALRNQKELLEKLGIRMLSGKTAAQRGAGARAAATRAKNNASESE